MSTGEGSRLKRPRIPLGNVLLLTASTLLGLTALEGLARYELSTRRGGKEQRERLLYTIADPVLGWRKVPGAQVTYRRRDFTQQVSINSHGLRDPEREYAATPGTRRVLALGDSFIEAYQVSLEDSVTQRLERSLSSGCEAEVINGGTAGYDTDQQQLFYREHGARYSPEVVVLFFYHNDVLDNVSPNYQPPPERVRSLRLAPRPPVVVKGSAALEWVGERLERSRPHVYNVIARSGIWAPTRRRQIASQFLAYKKKPRPNSRIAWQISSREIEEAWSVTERILASLSSEVERDGAKFAVAYIPSRMEVRHSDWELTVLRYGLNEERWDLNRVRSELSGIGRRHGFPVLDLTDAMKAEVDLFSLPYYEHDGHWNSLGHRIAATEVEHFLRQEGWLSGC